MSDFDSPWKEALDLFFELFLAFFFPDIHAEVDWSRDHESLDTELRQLVPKSETGARRADRLVKVFPRPEGEEAYLHVEVQAWKENDFERRVYVYNYRTGDHHNQGVVSLVILGDEDPDWRPKTFVFRRWGCKVEFEFRPVKLLDYQGH